MTNWSRREFLAASGGMGLAVAAQGLMGTAGADPLGLPVGIQLWTVNAPLQKDPRGTLAALHKIGFRAVETAGFGDATAKQFRGYLDEAHLACPSAHLNFMGGDMDAVLADANALGVHYAVSSILRLGTGPAPVGGPVVPGFLAKLLPMTLDDAKVTAALANKVGEQARKAGLQYVYHNHFFEFAETGKGVVAYEVLLKETDPELVQFEIDCGWMVAAGASPVEYFKRYPSRFSMIHVKDFEAMDRKAPVPAALRVGAALGRGSIDYKPIFAAARKAGLRYYFAEQEAPFVGMTELEAAKLSYDYLHALRES
jgi:sugar phosphate isomerase/epimerase